MKQEKLTDSVVEKSTDKVQLPKDAENELATLYYKKIKNTLSPMEGMRLLELCSMTPPEKKEKALDETSATPEVREELRDL